MAAATRPGIGPALAPGLLSLTRDDYQTSDREGTDDAGSEEAAAVAGPAAALPTEVMQQILYLTDPETFASLTLVNGAWRKAADNAQIYAHQLANCPSRAGLASAPADTFHDSDLPALKRQWAQEAKRNLFTAFLRPQQTVINLISNTTSSSAAFPYGEGFEFSFSDRAQYCLALSSSRIIVIHVAAPVPAVCREFKVVRRPLSAYILADGSLLAVLAASHRVNLYDLTRGHVMFKRSIELQEAAHIITMTREGEILAAGGEGGVEVVSLAESGPRVAKRVIKCDRIDHLAFSQDGMMLLGTTQASRTPSTVVLTAPYFTDFSEHEMDRAELLSRLWTSQIIFPNSSRDCSHAALLPRLQDHDANWTLAYDRVFESFRAVRTDDLRNGTTYFTGPEAQSPQHELEQLQRAQELRRRSKSVFTPKSLPAITPEGDLVAAAFLTSDIWLYGVPDDLEHSGIRYAERFGLPAVSPSASAPSSPRDSRWGGDRLPRWQLLVDKYRNVFAKGRKVASVTGASSLCWCTADPNEGAAEPRRERLVIAAPGGVSDLSELHEEDMAAVDGGRLVVLDFHFGPVCGTTEAVTIEVGLDEPELLEEEDMDMDEEIAVVRRRTLARQEGVSRMTVSSVADVLRPATLDNAPPVPPLSAVGFGLDRTGTDESVRSDTDAPSLPDADHGLTIEEAIEGLDGPYSQTAPRSRGTVYRSAAAVEANRRRNPVTPANQEQPQFRRTDGTEVPHESDADNWVPPPPAYGQHVDDDRPPQEVRRSFTADGLVSPISGTIPRRPVGSPRTGRPTDPRQRMSADMEGTRWFSRHESNRSSSSALAEDVPGPGLQRSPTAPTVHDRSGPSSPLRSASTYTPRSSLYRAALQPAGADEPSDSLQTRPSLRSTQPRYSAQPAPRPTPERLDLPLPSPAGLGPESATRASRDRSISPIRDEDSSRRPSGVTTEPVAPPSPLHRPATTSEPSAYQLNSMAFANANANANAAPPSPKPASTLGQKLGFLRHNMSSPEPSRSRSPQPHAAGAAPQPAPPASSGSRHGAHLSVPTSDASVPARRTSRRSLGFARRRPKTEDPAVLTAAASAMPETTAATPRVTARTTAQTQSYIEPAAAGPRSTWERAPRSETPVAPIHEHTATTTVTALGPPAWPSRRRTRRTHMPAPPEPIALSPLPTQQEFGRPLASEPKRSKNSKCIVM